MVSWLYLNATFRDCAIFTSVFEPSLRINAISDFKRCDYRSEIDKDFLKVELKEVKPTIKRRIQWAGADSDHVVSSRLEVDIPEIGHGIGWLDYQKGDFELNGWKWLSLQLDSMNEICVYRLRDGYQNLWIHFASEVTCEKEKFVLEERRRWHDYPVSWRLVEPDNEIDLAIEARFDRQEVKGWPFWEGAMTIDGHAFGAAQRGVGFCEVVK